MTNEESRVTKITSVIQFEREELHLIEQKALAQAELTPNPHWKRALAELAYAANVLDAHIGRSTIKD